MPRKPMTPQQKAAKAQRERERYQKARKAGFTPDESRSLKKSIQKNPNILSEPTESLLDLMGTVKGAADWLLSLAGDALKPDKPKREPKGKRGRTSTKKGRRTSSEPVKKERKTRSYDEFDEYLKQFPDLPVNEVIRKYRAAGGRVGNEKAKERARAVREKPKDVTKITRFHYYSNDERPIFGDKHLIKDRYMYLVQYEIEQQDAGDTKTDWMYIASNEEMSMRQIKEHALDMWKDGYVDGREKYKAIRIIPESIHLIHAVDTSL